MKMKFGSLVYKQLVQFSTCINMSLITKKLSRPLLSTHEWHALQFLGSANLKVRIYNYHFKVVHYNQSTLRQGLPDKTSSLKKPPKPTKSAKNVFTNHKSPSLLCKKTMYSSAHIIKLMRNLAKYMLLLRSFRLQNPNICLEPSLALW